MIEDYQEVKKSSHPEIPLGTLLMIPLGDYGQLHVGSPTVEEFDASTRELIELLGRNAEAALERSEREHSLREREQELQRQNDRLEEFAEVISHDLRNPLNVAMGNLALANEECDSEYIEPIGSALDRMEDLIEDVLEIARAGEQVTEIEPIELKTITETCWRTVATGEATFVVASECVIRADRTRVAQLLENLFRNTIEHGGDAVTITIGDIADGAGFYVADDGPGIPEGERTEVFETGYSTSQEGTGLGLSIVKRVAEAHDWDITLTESRSGGARFEIRGVEIPE